MIKDYRQLIIIYCSINFIIRRLKMYAIFHSSSVLRYFFNLLVKPILHSCFFETEHFLPLLTISPLKSALKDLKWKKNFVDKIFFVSNSHKMCSSANLIFLQMVSLPVCFWQHFFIWKILIFFSSEIFFFSSGKFFVRACWWDLPCNKLEIKGPMRIEG